MDELKELITLTKKHIIDMKKSGITEIDTDISNNSVVDSVSPLNNNSNEGMENFKREIENCQKCHLSKTRTKFVFGEGSINAELIFVGEAPGRDEDQQGRPFVGRAGQLLTKIIEAMKMKRDDVYICNLLKCRPPENRAPQPDEIEVCKPYLDTQLSLLKNKKVICCLGLYSAQNLLGIDTPMKDMRGNWYEYKGTKVIVTYHPAYLLRSPNEKVKVWNDMQKVMKYLVH
jgi:DNA polymerase